MIDIELFACSGGMAMGFRRAGIHFDLVVDWDPDACASYEANLGHAPLRADVRALLADPRHELDALRGHVDLLVADPPCTPWSRAGKRRGVADERDLLLASVEFVRRVRPRAFLIANVPGLDDAPNWPIVQATIGSIDGYCVDFARLDAANYGTPQHRIRPFWFGHDRGGACIRWPERTHGSPDECATLPLGIARQLRPWVTCREALADLPLEDLGRPVSMRWKAGLDGADHRPSRSDAPARTLTRNTSYDGATIVARVRADGSSRELDLSKVAHTIRGGRSSSERMLADEWPWGRPATTVTADPNGRIGPPSHHGKSFLSAPNAIVLSERAAARPQGFPDGWRFAGATKRSRWGQIGMAMPPPLSEAVARSIMVAMAKSERGAA